MPDYCTSNCYEKEELRIYDRAGMQFCEERVVWQGQCASYRNAGYYGKSGSATLEGEQVSPVPGRCGLYRLRGWIRCRFDLKNGASLCCGEALLPVDVLLRLPECAPYELRVCCELQGHGFFADGARLHICVSGSCEVLALVRVPKSCRPKKPPVCPPPCKSPCRIEPPGCAKPPLCPPPYDKDPCREPWDEDPCAPPMVCVPLYPPDFCRRC